MEKSLNQRWKESGTTLSYKEWRRREDDKMASFDGLPSVTKNTARDTMSAEFEKKKQELKSMGGFKETISGKTVFGINKYVIIVAAVILVGAVGYKIYKKRS
jgi:hypothetical protein